MQIIGLGHKKFVGKSTVAEVMKKLLVSRDCYVEIRNFTTPLKAIAHQLWPKDIKTQQYYEMYPKEKHTLIPSIGKTVRQVWIEIGNNLRLIDNHVWIKALLDNCEVGEVDCVIIPDVRYPTESDYLKAQGGLVFKVERDSAFKSSDAADDALNDWHNWTNVIPNHGTIEELEETCKKVLTTYNVLKP